MTAVGPPPRLTDRLARSRRLLNGFGWVLTVWGLGFTCDLAARADNVTSRQWHYLMSVPGNQWSWAAIFGAGTALLIAGMLTNVYRLRAIGCGAMAFGSGLTVAFYMAAPMIDPGLTTLGYWPWIFTMLGMIVGAVVNWNPTTWF